MTRPPIRLLLALALAAPAAAQDAPGPGALGERALALVNESRGEAGLDPLAPGENLDDAAEAHARDMERRGYYAHASPEGAMVRDRFLDAGGSEWELVAENIARCEGCPLPPDPAQVEELHQGWMESPGHRANILGEGLARFGYGLAWGEGVLYAVQTFAGPGTAQGVGAPDDAEPVAAEEAQRLALAEVNAARREAGVPELAASEALAAGARALVPEDLSGFGLDGLGDPYAALPEEGRGGWAALASVAGTCGGCGTEATRGDMRAFVAGWLGEGGYRDTFLDPAMTHMGVALRADGAGRKVALALVGQQR